MRSVALLTVLVSACGGSTEATNDRVLVLSRTAGYRHPSIASGHAALSAIAIEREWELTATEEVDLFTDDGLADYGVVVFLNTTGDILDDSAQQAFERFIGAGGGFVGIHAATDTEYDWPFYGELVGAYYASHPEVQSATIVVESASHPSTALVPGPWMRADEWYNFQANPRGNVEVLLSLDESSYSGGDMGDHPIAWFHEYAGGRAFYTGLGHTDGTYVEPEFVDHIAGGIEWALSR